MFLGGFQFTNQVLGQASIFAPISIDFHATDGGGV